MLVILLGGLAGPLMYNYVFNFCGFLAVASFRNVGG